MKLAEFLNTVPNQDPTASSPLSDFLLVRTGLDLGNMSSEDAAAISEAETTLLLIYEHGVPEDLGAIIRGENEDTRG